MADDDRIKFLLQKRLSMTRYLASFKEFLDKGEQEIDFNQLSIRYEKLEAYFKDFEELHDELELLDSNIDYTSQKTQILNDYFSLASKSRRLLAPLRASQTTNEGFNASLNSTMRPDSSLIRRKIKLPQIVLPTFSGKLEEWLSFRDTFDSMIHKQDESVISSNEKLQYLRSALTGEALRKIVLIPITDENYIIAWNTLVKAYENKRMIISRHLSLLLKLPEQTEESYQGLIALADESQQHMHSLASLNIKVNPEIVVQIIEHKLHNQTLERWDESIKGNEFPTLETMIEFLYHTATMISKRKRSDYLASSSFGKTSRDKKCNKHEKMQAFLTNSEKCSLCTNSHPLFMCEEFKKLSVDERQKIVEREKACKNCLRKHENQKCKFGPCKICKKKGHNSLLHYDKKGFDSKEKKSLMTICKEKTCLSSNTSQSFHLMPSALVEVFNHKNMSLKGRLLLDTCATANFISENLVQKLNLKKKHCDFAIGALNDLTTRVKYSVKVSIKSIHNDFKKSLTFLVLPNLVDRVPSEYIEINNSIMLKDLQLADPEFNRPAPIDLLLGAGPTFSLFSIGQRNFSQNNCDFYAQKTRLGWVIGGGLNYPVCKKSTKPANCFMSDLKFSLEKFWSIEELHNENSQTFEESEAEKHFVKYVQQDPSGRFIVALPFKANGKNLGNSRDQAHTRLNSLARKFKSNPEFAKQYKLVIQEYIELGHMRPVTSISPDEGYYLPHHAVTKNSSNTTKLRVVFDASAKSTSGVSLNDCLMVGPKIQDDLFNLLIRFRAHRYVIQGDIEKMYRQFLIRPEDRKYQKLIFFADESYEKTVEYELQTVTFGFAPAMFLAIRCIIQLAKMKNDEFPAASKCLLRDLYVDNLLTGAETFQEAKEIIRQVIEVMKFACLNMRQWASNNPELLEDIEVANLDKDFALDYDHAIKTLGMFWKSSSDRLIYTVKHLSTKSSFTKRIVFSFIAQLFDPLGLLGPMLMFAKLIIQLLWIRKVDWDESLPLDLYNIFFHLYEELGLLHKLTIKRRVVIEYYTKLEVHGFSDASERGYGACIYLVSKNPEGETQSSLLCSKSRVAPIKTLTIPKLELCGALLLSKLYHEIQKSFKGVLEINENNTFLYTDSQIVLHWLFTPINNLKIFVANRVAEIVEKTNIYSWRHVSSPDNPADALSRGQSPREFMNNQMWFQGPAWLCFDEKDRPISKFKRRLEKVPEIRKILCFATGTQIDWEILKRISSYSKLKRVIAYCLRFLPKYRLKGPLDPTELERAENYILRIIQGSSFPEETRKLTISKQIASNSKILNLDPFLDNKGLLRVGGRLQNSNLSFSVKHPIILPKSNLITDLIIQQFHTNNFHAGHQTTLYLMRQKFWVVDGRNQIRKNLRKCLNCFRAKPVTFDYKMGNLPESRVTLERPFFKIGIDYCGPFHIKEKKFRNRFFRKIYVCVFICMATKAVHIEVASDLSTEDFLAALKRFIARRGKPSEIFSDNGTNFVGANNELRELYVLFQSESHQNSVINYCTEQNIKFKFIPPSAPFFGGLWESAVRRFKYHFKRVSCNKIFVFEEFVTLATEIEAVLNSRPLFPVSTDPNDLTALTPGHFLIGTALSSLPEQNLQCTPTNRLSSWQHVTKVRQDFWKRWQKEYLNELQTRQKWNSAGRPVKENMLVIIQDDNAPSMSWELGRIKELHPGPDGIVRTVTLQTTKGPLKRPVRKLAPLPIADNDVQES